jgi:Rieske Fe-S protein
MEAERRNFLKKSLYATGTLLGLGFLVPALALLSPVAVRKKGIVYVPLCSEEDLPRSGVKKAELVHALAGKERKARVFIVSSARGLEVFSAVCSHLGCLVNYNKEKGEFICPCHGGRYDLAGKNIAGPPPAPLTVLPSKIAEGMLLVGIKV